MNSIRRNSTLQKAIETKNRAFIDDEAAEGGPVRSEEITDSLGR
jgi:hypothetical protein